MKPIRPHLWFDTQAQEAAELYTSVFPDSKIDKIVTLRNVPSPTGRSDSVYFELAGQPFVAISAGPLFTFNPSISFLVACQTRPEVDAYWAKLRPGGSELMELGQYPFSDWYGWLTDKYGLSWQIMLRKGDYPFQRMITPTLMYVGQVNGKAEEAMRYYASVFPNSKVGDIARYPAGTEPNLVGKVMHGSVTLLGEEFFAMDGGLEHPFTFNEAISLMVSCDTQAEIDALWSKLSSDPNAEQCGWCRDRFGVEWQITPTYLQDVMMSGDQPRIDRATQAFLPMKKLDLAALHHAAEA
jgi:predicted 3-demethylubiquinone-9 3-methyltransferase (glyoxalase superfamily)